MSQERKNKKKEEEELKLAEKILTTVFFETFYTLACL